MLIENMRWEKLIGMRSIRAIAWGAKGTLSQPLADRLTTVEKERVRAYYNGETFGKVSLIELLSYRRVLDGIFGEDFFKEMSK